MSQNKETPSPLWTRLREKARATLQTQYNELAKKTLDPDLCLEPHKEMMRDRQYLLGQFNRDIELLKHDGLRSRALAVVTLLLCRP